MDSKIFREAALAYQAVYDEELRQEIVEQQAFENWVNSLVEEGYDLSEYTWEEMYEAYIEEQGGQRGSGSSPSQMNQSVRIPGGRTATRVMSDLGTSLAAANKVPTSSGPRNVRGGGQLQSTSKPAAKPAPAAAKPAPTAPAAKPAAAKPAPTPSAKPASQPAAAKPSAMDQWAKANPRLAQAQKIRQQGGSRAEVNKSLYNKGTAPATSTPTVVKAGVDLFDIVRGYLLDGGFAETLEEAEWLMANVIDEEAVAIILGEEELDEGAAGDVASRAQKLANQRKGQTPERKKMYQGLADKSAARERGPFKGGTSRQGMTPSERTRSREAAAYQADVHGGSATYGKGSLPKGKKLERQRARGVSERFEAWLDEALTGERYKKVMKKPGGTAYSRRVSADPAKRATRGGRGGESDFGAGDRGSGNKAARRAGTYKEYNVNEAQAARENPEKYEREQAKKSAPVRGERTPMPPRGDKRREDFEKWYAKQMGR